VAHAVLPPPLAHPAIFRHALACAALGQHRSTQRKVPRGREDEERLTADIIELARQYGRYGYRKIAGLLRQAGWTINDKRVERIWRREGLKVPHNSPSAAGSG
jgi:putative transposase